MGVDRDIVAQLRRGALQYCLLAMLVNEERYGFELVRTLGEAGMVTSEGTVYPILSRLRSDGYVTTTWRESAAGPPRKYYAITAEGRQALHGFRREWKHFRDTVDELIAGGN